ncbi:MAG: dTMP kinase [Cyanobacteria bacterium REEB494]|uniref:dTMP kinase n=1 Tax=Cylindrospermopsis raciborskii TaxID=77022 RepID=UPI002ED8D0F7|nr:dTMP kinase [Cyanobacteria bacterium REEB494]
MIGKLIVFEGVEGSGKTTQMQMLAQWLQTLGISFLLTREPGGTHLGQNLRKLLLETFYEQPLDEMAELLLYTADRSQHVGSIIKPNLATGKYILCDRYTNSTVAYQGYGRGLNMIIIDQLNQIATGGLESDLTIWLDIDVEIGLSRKRGQAELDRMEQETIEFHHRVQEGYNKIAKNHPSKIIRVDGNREPELVQENIRKILIDNLFVKSLVNTTA